MTREELAEAAGLSPSTIKLIETGKRGGRAATLAAIARALRVSTTDLHVPSRGVRILNDSEPDGLLAVRRALNPPLGLEPEMPNEVPSIDAWRGTFRYAERLYDDDQYDAVLEAVPVLIEEATILHRMTGEALPLARSYLYTAQALTQLRRLDLANNALEKAARLAEELSDELIATWAISIQCWAMLLQRRFQEVERLAVATADRIEPKLSAPASPQLATWGWLMCRASAASIRDARTDDAEEYMNQAKMAAARLGDARPAESWTIPPVARFCEVTVGYKTVENAVLIGDHGKGLELAAQIPPSRIPTVNNRNRHQLDIAAAYVARGDHGEAIGQLMDLRGAAPKWLSHQGYARGIVRDLVEHQRRSHAEQLGVLADHVRLPL